MKDPIPQFTDVINKLSEIGIGHIHLIESRISGHSDVDSSDTLHFAFNAWKGTPVINGEYTPGSTRRLVENHSTRNIVVTYAGHSFPTQTGSTGQSIAWSSIDMIELLSVHRGPRVTSTTHSAKVTLHRFSLDFREGKCKLPG